MEDYVLSPEPLHVSDDGFTHLFQATSSSRRTRPILIRRQQLTLAYYQSKLPIQIDAIVVAALTEACKADVHSCKFLEVHVDVKFAPEYYYVYHVFEMRGRSFEEDEDRQRSLMETAVREILAQTMTARVDVRAI